jgi:glycosyltransferase involved in cell wall biosynthesis
VKILVVHQFFLSPGEPGGTRFNDFARLWRDAGHEVEVVASSVSYDSGRRAGGLGLWRSEVVDGTPVRRAWTLAHPRGGWRKRFASMVGFGTSASVAATIARRSRPDVVVATSPSLTAAVPGIAAAFRFDCPFVFEVRDLWPESAITTGVVSATGAAARAGYALEAFACEIADAVVGVTPAIVDDMVRRELVPRERTAVITNGIDLAALPKFDRDAERRARGWDGKFVAVYAGAHGRANALDQLVEAAKLLAHRRDTLLVCVGRGPERSRLMAQSGGLDNILWLDGVAPDEVFRIVAASNAALVLLQDNPTFRTVYPNKMFTAMAAEVPVVLAVDGIARELVQSSRAGLFVQPESPRDLAAAIGGLIGDPVRCLQMGWAGRELVAERFDRRDQAAAYLELLKGLA